MGGTGELAYQTAIMYENGIGTEPSDEKALEYYRMALSQGYIEAEIDINRLSGQ